MLLLVTLPEWGIYALLGFALFQSTSLSLYDMAYHVDFSKVKHDDHAGKEIGYMHMLEQIARGSSPFIGGFIAFWFGPQVTLFVAATIFLLSALPLFLTPEPWKRIRHPVLANAAFGYDTIASSLLWSLFVAIAVFGISSNTIYAQLGVLATLTMITGILSAKAFGMIVDRTKGKELLRVGVFANSLTHISRVFVATPLGVVFVNVFNELATTGFTLPFTKGLFALADDLPGYRIAFISIMNASASVGAAILCLIAGTLTLFFDEAVSLQITYAITAVVVLGILTHRFPALNPGRFKL